jgi:hypothetical protein
MKYDRTPKGQNQVVAPRGDDLPGFCLKAILCTMDTDDPNPGEQKFL